jgi:hypothetical protein
LSRSADQRRATAIVKLILGALELDQQWVVARADPRGNGLSAVSRIRSVASSAHVIP